MSVPAHDERDFEFAKKFGLHVQQVISEPHLVHEHHAMQAMALERAYIDNGVLVHSDYWNGKTSEQAKKEMTEYAEKHGFGEAATTYRLRDWGVSRQRFWGSPIPIVYCENAERFPKGTKICRLNCLTPPHSPEQANRRWRRYPSFTKRPVRIAACLQGARPTRWTRSLIRLGTFSVIWIRKTRISRFRRIRQLTGRPLTNTSAVTTMP